MRDVFRGDDGGGRTDNAVELAHAGAAAAGACPGTRAGGIGRAGAGARGRGGPHRARRGAALVVGRPGAGLVWVGRRADIDRRKFGRCNVLCVRECYVEGENSGGEKNRAMPHGGCGGGRHGSDLGMTSVARHSEPGPTIAPRSVGEANVCTPRPTSSRVTTADGRSPGSRVVTLHRLPRTEISQWHMTKDSPLTVAGAATALGISPRTAFPFDPQTGNRHVHLGLRRKGSQSAGRRGTLFVRGDLCPNAIIANSFLPDASFLQQVDAGDLLNER